MKEFRLGTFYFLTKGISNVLKLQNGNVNVFKMLTSTEYDKSSKS